ncbi:MAG: 3D-(3,5/4)-trihydroxycyclohexane-1,2-dione acylhydrolase (decyclizing), partial [Clostridia bacterium]|nr:3D-(3,5/4)-trihydroxycyclohexane-1,2-dione acylhydrolase (decyclizing) [Clostridia bacterium]
MTMGQALVKFLDNQYVSFDGKETKFVDGIFTVFGHGIVCGLGQALDENPGSLRVYQGKNEQGMAHVAASFAKQHNRRKIIACSSSIGPGAANMITAAATATVNNVPLLLLPADTFACRQPDPVLQQFEQPISLSITTNDAYKPVCRYWDRVVRPEQLMSAMINAMRTLTDTANTGAVCVSIPQDVEGESFDYPEEFFQKRVHKITRIAPAADEIEDIAEVIKNAKKPLIIAGGGVRYSEAGQDVQSFCEKHNIPFAETQNGKSAVLSSHPLNLGGVGVTGNLSANLIAKDADVIIGIGTRFSDFTTASKSLFKADAKFITINTDRFDAYKLSATKCVCDA